MLATILKNADGSFAVLRFLVALIGVFLAVVTPLWFLPCAIKSGRIGYFAGAGYSRTAYIERAKNPIYFWLVCALYGLLIPLGIDVAITACLGPTAKPN